MSIFKDGVIGGFKIEEITLADYPAKKYTAYGVDLVCMTYVLEPCRAWPNGNPISHTSSRDFNHWHIQT